MPNSAPTLWVAGRKCPSCLGCENVHGAFQVVGDGGEVDLNGGVSETSPSHSALSVAAFPSAEVLLDPTLHSMDRLIPFLDLAQRLLFVAAPHAGSKNPRNAAL